MKRILLLLSILALPALAEDGAGILRRVDAIRNPLENFAIDIELTSFTRHDSETSRVRVYGKGPDRSVVEFTHPRSEKGKRLLMLRDAMWIYLPSASRPIRISPMQRLTGQASNGDVARMRFATDYDVVSVTSEESNGRPLRRLDLVAKDRSIAYSSVHLWVDSRSLEPVRADFHAASGKPIKRAHYAEVGQLNGRRVVTRVEIENLLRAGERTVMRYTNLVPHDSTEKMFTRDALAKW